MKTPKLRTCGFLVCAFNTGNGKCTCKDIALDKYGSCVVAIIRGQEMTPYREAAMEQTKEESEEETKNPIGFAAE